RIIHAALEALGSAGVAAWVAEEPRGAFSRRAWFLYEFLTGETLDLPTAPTANYIDALDETRHFGAPPVNAPRQRVRNNLLGPSALCPVVRRTPRLEAAIQAHFDVEAQALTAHYDPGLLARAVNFLYTRETRSTFALEGEVPGPSREERFVRALRQ